MSTPLSRTDEVAIGDLFILWKTAAGDYRGCPASDVLTFFQSNLTFTDSTAVPQFDTQYSAPSATGFTVAITDSSANTHLILTPVAGYAAGTITLPAVANVVNKQEILVNCTQAVTTLTVNGNGATAVTGEPASLSANDFFKLKYDAPTSTWYRVG